MSGLDRGVHLFRVAVGAPFPNPFAGGTALPLAAGTGQHVRVTVLDVLGREVAVLFDGAVQPGGETLVPFAAGADLPAGLYVLRVVSEGGATSRTVTLRR